MNEILSVFVILKLAEKTPFVIQYVSYIKEDISLLLVTIYINVKILRGINIVSKLAVNCYLFSL